MTAESYDRQVFHMEKALGFYHWYYCTLFSAHVFFISGILFCEWPLLRFSSQQGKEGRTNRRLFLCMRLRIELLIVPTTSGLQEREGASYSTSVNSLLTDK